MQRNKKTSFEVIWGSTFNMLTDTFFFIYIVTDTVA